MGPTVDEVADEYKEHLARWPFGNVLVNLLEELLQQVQAPMDIPYSIGAPPARAHGTALPSRSKIEHLVPLASVAGGSVRSPPLFDNHGEAKPLLNLAKSRS
jgi:hypothetical protein